MKFVTYFFASVLLLSLCNSEPLLKQLGIIPITNSKCGASGSPTVACAFTAVFYFYITLICRAFYSSGNVAEIGSFLFENVPAPLNTVFSSIFGGISNGALTTAENCPITFDIWNNDLDPLCPVIFDLIFDILEATSLGEPLKPNGTEGIPELSCTIIAGYSLTERVLCALDSTTIELAAFLPCLLDQLPVGVNNVATSVMNGLLMGLNITGEPCAQALQFFDDSVESLCPAQRNQVSETSEQILNLISF
ncbi:uncharacterized protein LOC119085943 [Bradysia coprophila]|uniref:uncharacterized protein LOC119085943 n=1 Tax=Bradysia coprophila TaxID=38358 RepID=UPI00187D83E6|nr:uncharacterized protein LOC119085943 [Bradysia coprophila]